jgi:DNA-directed RNA polymerase specialized sigma24 family protein
VKPPNAWFMLHDPNVQTVVKNVARRVSSERGIEQDDIEQEAWIRVTDVDTGLWYMAKCEKWGLLTTALYRDMLDITKREASNEWRHQSFDVRHSEDVEGDETGAPVTIIPRRDVSQYDRELVQSLLPAVWDWQFCWGMQVENAPDADMPRSAPNKATGNTLAAHLADIRSAWLSAPLTLTERQALFLLYALDLTQQESGHILGITQQSVSENGLRGVGKIVALLNGDQALMDSMEEAA